MQRSESDVPTDSHLAGSRAVGGNESDRERDDGPDGVSTTGVEPTEEFVGRVAGDDAGYAGETGAEARSEAVRKDSSSTGGER